VQQIIKMPYFDEIRTPELEKPAPFKIYLGCDQLDSVRSLTVAQMREIIMDEVDFE
jgi:hypothetical protein